MARCLARSTETVLNYGGRGALNKAAISNGVRLTKNIYAGVEAAFLFGNISSTSDSQVLINSLPTFWCRGEPGGLCRWLFYLRRCLASHPQ